MFNTDQPIKVAKEDLLGRAAFAKSLAKAITLNQSKESLTLGLYGSWGSGKTSVLNLIEEELFELSEKLTSTEKPIIIRFNPWNISNQEQLLKQFFVELSHAIKINAFKDTRNDLGNLIEKYSNLLAVLVPPIGTWGQIMAKMLKRERKEDPLSTVKKKLYSNLLDIEFKIIIMIDDIDRLNSYEIRQVFQLVKVIADFPNSIYILSFDRTIVEKALESVQDGNGLEYLEKIIQIPFEIPEVNQNNVHKLFFTKLDEILKQTNEEDFDQQHWALIFQKGIANWIKNVRDVTRVINTFSLKYSLVEDETNFVDLLALVTLEIFEPRIYEEIKNNNKLFTGQSFGDERLEENRIKEQIDEIINSCSKGKKEAVEDILCELFPKISVIYKKWGSNNYDEKHSRKFSMIRNPECFDVYFKLTLSENSVSKIAVKNILFDMDEESIRNKLIEINNEGKFVSFVEISRAILKDQRGTDKISDRITILLRQLFMNWNLFRDHEEKEFFSMPFLWRLLFISEDLLTTISDEDKRYSIIHQILSDVTIALNLRISQLLSFEHNYGRFTTSQNVKNEKLISLENVIRLESELYQEISERSKNNNDYELLDAMYFWKEKNIEEMNSFIKNVLLSDEGLVKMIGVFVSIGKEASDFVYQIYTFHKAEFEEYCDVNEAWERVNKILINGDAMRFSAEEIKKNITFSISVISNDFESKKTEEIESEYLRYLNDSKTEKVK